MSYNQIGSAMLRFGARVIRPSLNTIQAHPRTPFTTSNSERKGLVGFLTGVGAVTYSTEKNDPQIEKERKLFKTPPSAVPQCINMLIQNDIPVNAETLLESLSWDELSSEEARAEHDKLVMWKQKGFKADCKTAVNICKKVQAWLALSELEKMEKSMGNINALVNEVLEQSEAGVSDVQHMIRSCRSKVKQQMDKGEIDDAMRLLENKISFLDSINEQLEDTRLRVLRSQDNSWRFIKTFLSVAGGCAVVFFGLEMIATLPSGVSLDFLQDLCLDCGVIALSAVAFEVMFSDDFTEHIKEIENMQTRRRTRSLQCHAMVNRLLEKEQALNLD